MAAVVRLYGQNTLIQFEDFANHFKLLEKYQNKYCTFNDDIQGTATIALAGIYSSLRITKTKMKDNVFLFLGAGQAALGIALLIVSAMSKEGMSRKEAASSIWLCDAEGLLCKSRHDISPSEPKHIFIKDVPHYRPDQFLDIIKLAKPTAILGASASAGAFNKEMISYMAEINHRPIIFAMSNPTSKAECTAADAYTHTDGRALFASGSPFPPFEWKGHTFIPGQGNNAYIFPGVGLGVLLAGVCHVTEDMFLLAAKAVADFMTEEELNAGLCYPPISKLPKVSIVLAKKIFEDAYDKGLATTYPRPPDMDEFMKEQLYDYNFSKSTPSNYPWPTD